MARVAHSDLTQADLRLDTNEGYCTRLIGSPATILERIRALRDLGIEMLHLDLRDTRFVAEVLPHIHAL